MKKTKDGDSLCLRRRKKIDEEDAEDEKEVEEILLTNTDCQETLP